MEAASRSRPDGGLRRKLRVALPPSRLVWVSLAIIGGYGVRFLGGLGLATLLLVPMVAVATDLAFSLVRFERLRVPDAAVATGLFVAVLLPPTTPLILSATAALIAVAVRHILRWRGHPVFNPAAVGVLLAAAVFGIAPAWWAGVGTYGEYLTVGLGLVLIARGASRWRLPATFLLAYGALAAVQHLAFGATTDPRILLLQALDPTVLFFALFMVPEPRSAPTAAPAQVVYAGTVGLVAAFTPIAFPTIGLLLALIAGNVLGVLLRRSSPASALQDRPRPTARPRGSAKPAARSPAVARWSVARRTGAGILAVVILAGVATTVPAGQHAILLSTGPPSAGGPLTGCSADNPSIPASTLSQLHHMLGPSVVRSYDASTGVVVFYDPVNHVTVTETDLYEDYGFAEFNGDDYAVSGCSS